MVGWLDNVGREVNSNHNCEKLKFSALIGCWENQGKEKRIIFGTEKGLLDFNLENVDFFCCWECVGTNLSVVSLV